MRGMGTDRDEEWRRRILAASGEDYGTSCLLVNGLSS